MDSGKFPTIWKSSFITPIHKKGATDDVNNYRGIALGSCLSKLFLSIINSRLTAHMDHNNAFDPRQAGFRKDYRTTDHIFILRTLIQKYKSSKKKLYACFVDFKKAFDTVWRDGLRFKLQQLNITGKIYDVISSMYTNLSYVIRTEEGSSNPVPSYVGVKQGCVCSPTLFNIYVNDLQYYLDTTQADAPVLNDSKLTHLLFADDLVLFSKSSNGLQQSIANLQRYTEDWKLSVNLSKTKILIFGGTTSNRNSKCTFYLNNKPIELCSSYTYLGIVIHQNGSFKCAITTLKGKAMRAWYKIKHSMTTSSHLSVDVLLRLYNVLIIPIATYGSEVWGTHLLKTPMSNPFLNWQKQICNLTTIKIAKQILGVPKRTTLIGSLSELGLYPMTIHILTCMHRYYHRLHNLSQDRLLYAAFQEDKKLGSTCPKASWSCPLETLIDSMSPSDTMNIKDTLQSHFNKLYMEATDQILTTAPHKLRLLGRIKDSFSKKTYLSAVANFHHRQALTKLRLSCHNLEIERGRYTGTPAQERYCRYCPSGQVEDEAHFLIQCPLYKIERIILLPLIQNNNIIQTLTLLLNPCTSQAALIARTIHNMLITRQASPIP